ncbi:MAG: oligosaccharide flippase family protein [Actinomycetota bacterium]
MSTRDVAPSEGLSGQGASDVATAAKGGVIQIVGQVTARGLLFIFVAVATRVLGLVGFGLYRTVFQILNIAGLFAPGGFNFAAVRFIARARALKDHPGVRGAAHVSIGGAALVAGVTAIAIYLGAERLASLVVDSASRQAQVAHYLRLGSAYIPLYSVMQVLRSCTQAYKTMVPSTLIGQVILPVGRLVLGIAALLAGYAVAGAVASLVISAGISMLAGFLYFGRMLGIEEKRAKPRHDVGPILRFAIPQAGVNSLGVQALGLSIVILSLLGTPRDVGLFAIALSLQGVGSVFLTGIVSIFSPMVVDIYERGEIRRLELLYQTINRWVATFSFPVFVALMVVPDLFTRALGGAGGLKASSIVVILALGNLFFVGTGPCSYLISMTGKVVLNFWNSLIAVILYIALGVWLVPRYGAVGMAVVDALVTALINSARVIEGKVLIGVQPFGRSYIKPVAATLVAAATLLLARAVAPDGTPTDIAALGAAGVAYLVTLRALGIDAEERHVWELLRSKARRKKR